MILMSVLKKRLNFHIFRSIDLFEKVWDRTIPVVANDGKPILQFSRINPSTDVFKRTYKKFSMFFARVNVILS